MPNTFDPDGRPDLMSNQDQLAYLKATGDTIGGRQRTEEQESKPSGVIDQQRAAEQTRLDSASDEARRSQKKIRQTSYGLPMTPK